MKKITSIALAFSLSANAADFADIGTNSSYLVDTKYQEALPSFIILDKSKSLQIGQQYEDMNRAYELKSDYGLADMGDRYAYINAMSSFSQNVFSQVRSYQVQSQRESLTNGVKNDATLSSIEQSSKIPAVMVGGLWSLYKGTSYTTKISDKTSISTGLSVHDRNASVSLSSKVISTSVSANNQGMTSNVSRMVTDHISVNFTNVMPIQSSGTVPSSSVGLSYGMNL